MFALIATKLKQDHFSTKRIPLPKTSQNMVFLMEPSSASVLSLKAGNMCLNRFCIEEDAAFELSGVFYLRESSDEMISEGIFTNDDASVLKYKLEGKLKGMGHYLSYAA